MRFSVPVLYQSNTNALQEHCQGQQGPGNLACRVGLHTQPVPCLLRVQEHVDAVLAAHAGEGNNGCTVPSRHPHKLCAVRPEDAVLLALALVCLAHAAFACTRSSNNQPKITLYMCKQLDADEPAQRTREQKHCLFLLQQAEEVASANLRWRTHLTSQYKMNQYRL